MSDFKDFMRKGFALNVLANNNLKSISIGDLNGKGMEIKLDTDHYGFLAALAMAINSVCEGSENTLTIDDIISQLYVVTKAISEFRGDLFEERRFSSTEECNCDTEFLKDLVSKLKESKKEGK